jgi:transcriptional regulator with XRE-family HTH domain
MGNNVAGVRRAQGVTQTELARKANVSRPYISLIESGKQHTISNIVMGKIASALNRSVAEIFFTNGVVSAQQSGGEGL